MGLLDLFLKEGKKYIKDALPGGLLNPELKPVADQAKYIGGVLDDSAPINRDLQGWHKKTQLGLADQLAGKKTPEAEYAYQQLMNMAGNAPIGIVSPAVAKTLNTVKNLPDSDLFRQAVANTPGAQVGDDGLRMMLQRNQMPEQSLEPSVRGGVFYLPEGAAQAKHYSTGKNGYGGKEKITGETLIQNPLFAKGGTGGKAPEAAYDQLAGKGAYQTMRTDALSSLGGYGRPQSEAVERVTEFLDKYAPELSDQAHYIVANSRNGNQLPYALQEAAVASAARNAGHDAVLGYSKGKNGHFLSELFDVRESHYPSASGESEVWGSLLK
jgi:hypothetical protein